MRIIKPRTTRERADKNGRTERNGVRSRSRDGAPTDSQEVARLLKRYRRSRSVTVRNEVVEHFRKSVEDMARALRARLPRTVDVQDLVHAGMWGLIQAIENYRAELGPGFLPFMRIRVRGAMIDELRNMDYLPRLYRSRVRMRDEAIVRLRTALDREPSDAEVAEDLGVSENRLRQLFTPGPTVAPGGGRNVVSDRDGLFESDLLGSLADHDQEAPIDAVNRRDLLELIESTLQPMEWDVLRLHYLEGMSGREVAKRLHLSASRICQIHGRVLSRLKSRLT